MEYDGDLRFEGVDGQWIVDGPNSGGVKFFVLWRGYLFLVEQDFSDGTIGRGVPAAAFAAAHRGTDDIRYRRIVADLDARGLTAPLDERS